MSTSRTYHAVERDVVILHHQIVQKSNLRPNHVVILTLAWLVWLGQDGALAGASTGTAGCVAFDPSQSSVGQPEASIVRIRKRSIFFQ